MPLRNTDARWGWPSMTLHWTIALLLFSLLVMGYVMGELPRSPKYFWVYDLHKSLGLTALVLMLIRLIWRLIAGAPKPEPTTATWQHLMATLTHWLMYTVAIAIPFSGWLYDSASGLRVLKYFGWISIPKLTTPNPELKSVAHSLHEYGALLLIALILAHAGAALVHHFVQRDRTLYRMLPSRFESHK